MSVVEKQEVSPAESSAENSAIENNPMRIDVWSDYNCPWCRLGTAGLDALRQEENVEVVWHSYELRPAGSPPMPPEYKARIEQGRPRLNQMAQEVYGITLRNERMGVDSRPALIGAKYAEEQGKGAEYHDRLMRAYWDEAQDIADLDVLGKLAEEVGLERSAYINALTNPEYIRLVDQDIETAASSGITGVPALVFAGKYLISGAQPPEALKQITAKVRAMEANPA